MRNEELFKSLKALAEQARNLEIETGKAVANMDEQIESARRRKETQICGFIEQMREILSSVDWPSFNYVDVPCCGTDWDGKPGACGSYQRDISLAISPGSAHFGRYFLGCGSTDKVLTVNSSFDTFCRAECASLKKAKQLREDVIDRWTPETEKLVEQRILEAAKLYLEKRMKEDANNLRLTIEQYEKYFGKEDQ